MGIPVTGRRPWHQSRASRQPSPSCDAHRAPSRPLPGLVTPAFRAARGRQAEKVAPKYSNFRISNVLLGQMPLATRPQHDMRTLAFSTASSPISPLYPPHSARRHCESFGTRPILAQALEIWHIFCRRRVDFSPDSASPSRAACSLHQSKGLASGWAVSSLTWARREPSVPGLFRCCYNAPGRAVDLRHLHGQRGVVLLARHARRRALSQRIRYDRSGRAFRLRRRPARRPIPRKVPGAAHPLARLTIPPVCRVLKAGRSLTTYRKRSIIR